MADPKYLKPENFDFCLAHAIEECGEFLAAAGKTQRWGLESVNPTLPPSEREHNGRWLLRELDDVEDALKRLRVRLAARGYESGPAMLQRLIDKERSQASGGVAHGD